MDQKADWRMPLFELPHELARLLRDPMLVGMRCAAREMDLTAAELDEHQNVERFQEACFYREEIAGQHLILIVGEELPPTGRMLSLRRRRDTISFQDICHCLFIDKIAKFE